jgi:hypothetical protein
MYVNPFIMGIFSTLMAEILLIIVGAVIIANKGDKS